MKRRKKITRMVSLFLTVVMLLSSLGTSVLSAEAEPVNSAASQNTTNEQTDTGGGGIKGSLPETPDPAQSRTVETSFSEESNSTISSFN